MRQISLSIEPTQLKAPFRITGHTLTKGQNLYVTISENGITGHGEAAGVRYLNETADNLLAQAESIRTQLEAGMGREQLRYTLPAGGARNAIDCALWDLEAKQRGLSIWALTNFTCREVVTALSIGISTPKKMAAFAEKLDTSVIKIKVDGQNPLPQIEAVCAARPDADILVDANQGWSFNQLMDFAPRLRKLGIKMIEQPLSMKADDDLEDYSSPVALCADESFQDLRALETVARRYDMINIKLDKTGGLTEALDIICQAERIGLQMMVGCMVGASSLALAPAYVVAQKCQFVDLDSATFLKRDREHPITLSHGKLSVPQPALWG